MVSKAQGKLFGGIDLTPVKSIRIVVSDDVQITETERRVIDTAAFQRLRRIKQLGTSYLIYPSAVHTRFEHSLGTLKMADLMVQKINDAARIQDKKTGIQQIIVDDFHHQLVRIIALLHDITQIPFGHTLEDETHVIPNDHDNDKERHDFFYGKDSEIGRILRDRLGEDGYILTLQALSAKKRKEEESDLAIEDLKENAYLCDIVKNTVCADLLDYLSRDSYFCNLNLTYGTRFLNFLFLARCSNIDTKTESVRLVGFHKHIAY